METIETVAIIPAHNEESRIGNVVRAALRSSFVDALIVVDDGSSDNTARNAENAAWLELPQSTEKPFYVHSRVQNCGKTEALYTGVESYAKRIGKEALKTLVFLDADSSPIWTRDTKENMKLWQQFVHKLFGRPEDLLPPETVEARQEVFINLLSQYINEVIEPVALSKQVMRTGMYQRNTVTDTVLAYLDEDRKGGHAGNRAVTREIWEGFVSYCSTKGIQLSGWQFEAALNAYTDGQETGTFMMYGVVNVGSRIKAKGFLPGLKRMVEIHSQAPKTKALFRR